MKTRKYIMPAAFILYLASVATLCFMHGDKLPDLKETWFGLPSDKVAHMAMFLPFIPLSFFTFRNKDNYAITDMLILTSLLILGVGTAYMTEVIQEKLSYRTYDQKDLYADCIGLGIGYISVTAWLIIKNLRKRL
jgi:VanZ family protein